MGTQPFFPGTDISDPRPLARFMPLVPSGAATDFLERYARSGQWVLDPFGSAPALDVELARAGMKVMVAVNNPITRFLLELSSTPPSRDELNAALSEIASSRKGEERLETHLRSLYWTDCHKCRRQVQADAFVWEKGQDAPVVRIYHCPCGEAGEFPVSQPDLDLVRGIAASDGLHRARAGELVAVPHDPDRFFVDQALECYLPRPLYVLNTIVNKVLGGSPSRPKNRQRPLMALILALFDEANSLWPHPPERPRPRQLTIPPRFLEKNLWTALEGAVERWDTGPPVQARDWDQSSLAEEDQKSLGERGGIYMFEGPARSIIPAVQALQPGMLVTALPRPNQAFWTLSALWAGWLWGRSAVLPIKAVLHRRRYDWNWHSRALNAALKDLSPHLPLNSLFFALLPEPDPGFLSAALLAADGAGFDLENLAVRTRLDPVQVIWRRRAFMHHEGEPLEVEQQAAEMALKATLKDRGEPVTYLHLHAAGLLALASEHALRFKEAEVTSLQRAFGGTLRSPAFVQYPESVNIESGLWGLSDWDGAEPLPDRVEKSIVNFLLHHPGSSFRDLEVDLNDMFPGLLTPSLGLVRHILASYAIQADERWTLRPEDEPSARRVDIETALQHLHTLAARFGYSTILEQGSGIVLHWAEKGRTVFTFHVIASAVVGKILRAAVDAPKECAIVLPGGRVGLLAHKLDRDPGLRLLARDWRVFKFRHLQHLVNVPALTPDRFVKELSGDLVDLPEQMKLF